MCKMKLEQIYIKIAEIIRSNNRISLNDKMALNLKIRKELGVSMLSKTIKITINE